MWWALILFFAILFLLFYASYNIKAGFYIRAYCQCQTDDRIVAVTFDDGPDPHHTPQVLDVLKEYDVKATFFCIGDKVPGNEDLLRRMVAEGHDVGNHSCSHSSWFPLFGQRKMLNDLKNSAQVLEEITGRKITFFRPPFGVTNPTLARVVRQLGYQTIGWSVRSFDTKGGSVDEIFQRVTRGIEPGAVILLHDRLPQSDVLLRKILDYLAENDYKTQRVDRLFGLKQTVENED